ncbi:hypothetical protein CQW23_23847 [Capsicum baccatum]|uniref:Alkane hydroxylase MAH1 n=1 Tax=Capsicum baccatum TaxID=33114 RepID=A0A2G2VT45_CAPBA|nr:hypothetical protein CQW23_23847 [Capsicum baccatum]
MDILKFSFSRDHYHVFHLFYMGLIRNAYRVHEFVTALLRESKGNFEFHGPVLANLNMLITSDPVNIHHILSRSFSNYPKGVEFRKIFDLLGNGIFNVDSELWEIHRKTTVSLMSHAMFQILLERSTWDTIENGLQPFLDAFVEQGSPLNLQDIFQRFTFDAISKLLLGYDPISLSIRLPYVPCEKAFNVFVDAIKNTSPTNCLSVEQVSKCGSQK